MFLSGIHNKINFMPKKFSWSGPIIVILCLACMFYYYLIFRNALNSQMIHKQSVFDNKSE